MLNRPAMRNLIALVVLTIAPAFVMPVQAGDFGSGQASKPPVVVRPAAPHVGPAIGGYSMSLSDIWGPAEMPPAPRDFGPHFDFQPEPLDGGLSHDPYPN
jgi:hypothetical protein